MPPTTAVRATGSTWMTEANADTSSVTRSGAGWPGRAASRAYRNRFDVGFASRTGVSAGTAAYASRSRVTAVSWAASLAGGRLEMPVTYSSSLPRATPTRPVPILTKGRTAGTNGACTACARQTAQAV